MLKGADLSKILDEGYGDAGFNDDVPDIDAVVQPKAKAKVEPAKAPSSRLPVLGATPPPADGVDLEKYEITQAVDTIARQKGFKDAEEYNQHLQATGAFDTKDMEEKTHEEMEQPAPGVRKPPTCLPPGAYPGDRTKVGKEFEKETGEAPFYRPSHDPSHGGNVETAWVKQSDERGTRANDGNKIRFRTEEDGAAQTGDLGDGSIPWALDIVARRMKVGDICDVTGRGEHAITDKEPFKKDAERKWRLELMSIEGNKAKDKFGMNADERIERANELRLQGNAMYKQGRLLRAVDYYERGSSLMDVLEAEDLGGMGKKDPVAADRNKRLWACSVPLCLNWALILMKQGRYREAERKCTEVLVDVEVLNVKALFRRGQCNLQLGNLNQARQDLYRAQELDTSIAGEVAAEIVKLEVLQKAVDDEERPHAQQIVQGYLASVDESAVDERCRKVADPPQIDPSKTLPAMLEAQQEAAERDGIDEDTYRRQREAIYNGLFAGQFQAQADDVESSAVNQGSQAPEKGLPRGDAATPAVAKSDASTNGNVSSTSWAACGKRAR